MHDDAQPAEVFLRVKGLDCTSELVNLYDVVARLMSLALQQGASIETVGNLLAGVKFVLCGPVSGHDCLKHCTRLPDLIGPFATCTAATKEGFVGRQGIHAPPKS